MLATGRLAVMVLCLCTTAFAAGCETTTAGAAGKPPAFISLAAPDAMAPGTPRTTLSCDNCGMFESMRLVPATSEAAALYELTFRLRDGSVQVVSDPSPGRWRLGERIKLIAATP